MLDRNLVDGVAILVMNRPKQRNAMSSELVGSLIAAFEQVAHDPAARAIVLAGADPGFCAGSDLAELAGADRAGRALFEAESGRLARMFAAVPKPVLAAVKGFAMGGGFTLATSCDIVVTHGASLWSLPEVPIGLFPAWGMASVVNRIGLPAARRLAWGVETLSGAEAIRLGLADHLAETDVLDDAMARARKLAELPVEQVAAVKIFCLANPPAEAADWLANQLFMSATETEAAKRTFEKFSKRRGPPSQGEA